MNWKNKLLDFDNLNDSDGGSKGLVFDLQKFAIHDGGGIRTIVFLKGCPLNCAWCANPESISARQEITFIKNNCIHCGRCLNSCPHEAINQNNEVPLSPVVNREKCTLCGECLKTCYAGALNIVGRYVSVEEVMAMIERDRQFYDQSNGGVTFSGGEPTAQPDFLKAALQEAKARGIHTAVETSGFLRWEKFKSILEHVDLALIDIKHMDSREHFNLTGVQNELILDNLKKMAEMGLPVRIRLPLITGYNDSLENLKSTAEFIQGLVNVQAVDILPYHRLGEMKWAQLDCSYNLAEVVPPTPEQVREGAKVFKDIGIKVSIGG